MSESYLKDYWCQHGEGYVLVLYIIIILIRMVSKIIRVIVRFPPVGCLMPAANKVSSVILGSI